MRSTPLNYIQYRKRRGKLGSNIPGHLLIAEQKLLRLWRMYLAIEDEEEARIAKAKLMVLSAVFCLMVDPPKTKIEDEHPEQSDETLDWDELEDFASKIDI
jgi:hypothetical protein